MSNGLKSQLLKLIQKYKNSFFCYFYRDSIAIANRLQAQLHECFTKEKLVSFFLSEFDPDKKTPAIIEEIADLLIELYGINAEELDLMTNNSDFAFSINESALGIFLYFMQPCEMQELQGPYEMQELTSSPAMGRRQFI